TGNRALLTNFVEKFLGTVCFGNNDFVVIAGYGDVVIGSMIIKKVYYIEGLPKRKFEKDHLCSACEQGKIHRKHHKSKTTFASNKPLYLLHMDLCGSMRVESINGKRYVLVIVDDYSRYTWVFFLHSKDEASEEIISFIKKTQVNLQLQVQCVRTDNGTEFKNKTRAKFFDEVGITQQFFAARTPQQNVVVERRNRTLVEAAKTMLTFIMKSSTTNVETSNVEIPSNEEAVFHESFESFQEESSLSSLNDDVQQKLMLPSESKDYQSNIDAASLRLNLFKDVNVAADAKAKDPLSKGPPQVVSEPFGELLLKKNTFSTRSNTYSFHGFFKSSEKRFGGNTETKKVQKSLLKQQFENFFGSSSKGLDQIHDRLQKLVSQLELHGVSLSQEDVNLKFLCSLPSEWNTRTLIWRNKTDLEDKSLDDLFKSLKIYESEVKL
nr:integrase, catalytic region, zinc finger, CCHC-type, peptidase aspartic, catalytic [Tanacetum cinerariifolium]